VARALGKRLVHRIDKATSGLLILADDARTVQRMQRLLAGGQVRRAYRFVAAGALAAQVIESELVRDRGDGKRGSGVGGKRATTEIVDVTVRGDVSHGTARLHTGRTHQIRIHLAEAGHPIVGDAVYGDRGERMLLHAAELSFTHPNTHALVEVNSAIPW
jgi:23S rRNA pseudouridine1911/1915/1917 synthase